MRKVFITIGISLLTIIIIGFFVALHFNKVTTIKIDDNLCVFLGGGGNSIVLTSDDGSQALIVDSKMGFATKAFVSQVKATNVTIVNTHLHFDHTGGNNSFQNATIIAGAYTQEQWQSLAKTSRFPDKCLKTGQDTILRIGSEVVHIKNMGKAHTWNDVIVYLEKRKFLITGDIIFNHCHPALYVQAGANTSSWKAVLDSLINNYEISAVLPGHGDLADKGALHDMNDYFMSIKNAVGNPEMLKAVKDKFKRYKSIPLMTGFDKTVSFIEKERHGN
jgi:glyoxylase-like metal-dependent hydrolase (beta-lactamase superfamily II)